MVCVREDEMRRSSLSKQILELLDAHPAGVLRVDRDQFRTLPEMLQKLHFSDVTASGVRQAIVRLVQTGVLERNPEYQIWWVKRSTAAPAEQSQPAVILPMFRTIEQGAGVDLDALAKHLLLHAANAIMDAENIARLDALNVEMSEEIEQLKAAVAERDERIARQSRLIALLKEKAGLVPDPQGLSVEQIAAIDWAMHTEISVAS